MNELSHIHLCNDVVVAAVAVVAVVVNNNAANFKFCALIYFYALTKYLIQTLMGSGAVTFAVSFFLDTLHIINFGMRCCPIS